MSTTVNTWRTSRFGNQWNTGTKQVKSGTGVGRKHTYAIFGNYCLRVNTRNYKHGDDAKTWGYVRKSNLWLNKKFFTKTKLTVKL
jgi:hypothetical protein